MGLYRKEFTVDDTMFQENGKIYITLGGVESAYYLYVNGVEVGYRLGCEYNCKAYWIGGILFLIAGADMVVTHFLF